MGSITRRKSNKKTYYYYTRTERVNGEPRVVDQKYLGRADEIAQKVTEPPVPEKVVVRTLGTVASLLSIAEEISLVKTINSIVDEDPSPTSVGTYMLIAAINRCGASTSKNKIAQWYDTTALNRLTGLLSTSLTSQRFWDKMDTITEEDILQIQTALAETVTDKYGLSLDGLVYDTTNFISWIDTTNSSEIPKRGHSKQKRNDLKQVGLALLVTREDHIPLYHMPYSGNRHDSVQFPKSIQRFMNNFKDIISKCEDITITIDKGNNSKNNMAMFDTDEMKNIHFVGSLRLSHHEDLLKIPLKKYRKANHDRLFDHRYTELIKEVFGIERRVICMHNPVFEEGQLQGIKNNKTKALTGLKELKDKLNKRADGSVTKGRKPTENSVRKQVEKILSGDYMKTIITHKIYTKDGHVLLDYSEDLKAFEYVKEHYLGKTILFTDRKDWGPEEVILAYRGQASVENAFKTMKHPVCWYPMFHWTDQKIRVHALYCVLALLISSLLRKKLREANLSESIDTILEQLERIQEVELTYKINQKKRESVTVMSDMTKFQTRLFEILNLDEYTI